MIAGELRGAVGGGGPTIVCAQAGEVNTGAFDPFGEIADACAEAGAWLHVDGAFGLWASVSPELRPLLAGVERADWWATDAHKWLNVPNWQTTETNVERTVEAFRAAIAAPAAAR
jgi:glutamate/tyrosine decarboxylase-like PLP-dependent enzyme